MIASTGTLSTFCFLSTHIFCILQKYIFCKKKFQRFLVFWHCARIWFCSINTNYNATVFKRLFLQVFNFLIFYLYSQNLWFKSLTNLYVLYSTLYCQLFKMFFLIYYVLISIFSVWCEQYFSLKRFIRFVKISLLSKVHLSKTKNS